MFPRHRSSTLKPVKGPPARLTISPPGPQEAQFTPASAQYPALPAQSNVHHTSGIRAHLAHLLPRHAAFTATLTVHQVHNVPLVHGEFGLKWKIKGVTSHSGNGILNKVKGRKAKGKPLERTETGGSADPALSVVKNSDTDNVSLLDATSASDAHSIANSSSPSQDHPHSTRSGAQGHGMYSRPVPIPAVVVSTNHVSSPPATRSVSGTSSIHSVGSASSMSSTSLRTDGLSVHNPPGYLSTGWSRRSPAQDTHVLFTSPSGDTIHHPQAQAKLHYTPAKGITPFVKLKEHSIVWEKTLKFVVQMSIGRDNGELGDCLAKFVVMQRVVAGDPDAPRKPRLGVVYLNLAQYVDAGAITRRYLLRQSKTNATLKLTIHLEHTAGELAYVAPPLPKDEILSGVAGFLESSDIYRARPRTSDLYAHTSSDSSSDDGGADLGSDASSIISGSGISGPSQGHGNDHGHANGHGKLGTMKKQRRPIEVSKLPTINDPRGTEKLIEALFNPVPVTQPSKVTPFTYLVEIDGEGDGDGDADADADADGDEHGGGERSSYRASRATSVCEDLRTRHDTADGEADDGGSLYADSPDENADEANGTGSDYHSLRSHPSLQGSLRTKHSARSLTSRVKLKPGDGAEEGAVSTGVRPLGKQRTWWQKVLSPPAVG